MKKIVITALAVLLLCVLAGCPAEDEGKTPASMTFVDNLDTPNKEFTIDENLNFKVKFINPSLIELNLLIRQGDIISGKITEADAAWDNNLTGEAEQMAATNPTFADVMPTIKVAISLTYTKAEGVISDVTVELQGDGVAVIAQTLMGGTYYRK